MGQNRTISSRTSEWERPGSFGQPSPFYLQVQYSTYKNTLQQIAQKIGDVEQEAEEHKLVLETLEPLPGDRKCFRMINGVLAERTVKDVIPALRTTAEGLKKVLDDLVKQYKTKQDELDKWKKKNNVQVVQS
ncbi:hypothetical protein CHGG_01528 [Chaetomium globosum CBS 148.51]|uniref:Prefoldin subunit 2 n=1 Tax=Chaetomium globosum (strain ATCC 6205 / CBS 148.51 / DSM 1962 / NBRC 6347 / NRRL 1970) TaxID=306901 RepID=Q2HE26_CHAGB|nr:uncharacterized protein CHGG_01528 [Chaetomium globosum CBS 148.51]EAQ93293.1 hypothetical protein CHGG_01528 [Chaetomium globosum CBS 148.51]